MYRLPVLATSLLLATPAFAGQPASAAQPAAAATVALAMPAAPAASDKVYPPLPTLAMLPPARLMMVLVALRTMRLRWCLFRD